MKIQDLQQPYRALAEMRREQQINSELFRKEVIYNPKQGAKKFGK